MHRSSPVGRRLLSLILAAGVPALSGCGVLRPENAAETLPPPPPEPVPMPAPRTPNLPPRPHPLPLDSTDPCELLTPAQLSQLGFDRGPTPGVEEGFGDAATCSFRNTRSKVAARLALVTIEGVEVWTSETAQVHAKPAVVAGFPALVVRTPGLELACNVAVDVAEGQHLDVLYRDDGSATPPPRDQLCAGARRVAEAVVTSLDSRASDPEAADGPEAGGPGAAGD